MLIWRGKGLNVFLILAGAAGVSFVLGFALTKRVPADRPGWVGALAFVLAGIACWYYGRHLHRNLGKQIPSPDGGHVVDNRKHDLFFIRVEYWGIILAIIGVRDLLRALMR